MIAKLKEHNIFVRRLLSRAVHLCIVVTALGLSTFYADSLPADEPRQAMRYSTDKSWYDYESDRLVFPDSSVLSEPAKKVASRHDRVVNKIPPPQTNPWEGWTFFEDLGGLWGSFINIPWAR